MVDKKTQKKSGTVPAIDNTKTSSRTENQFGFTDFIDQSQYLWAYGYQVAAIRKMGEEVFLPKWKYALFRSLAAVRDSGNKRVRERAFTIWAGYYGDLLWCAVPGKILSDVPILMSTHIASLDGFYGGDFGSNDDMKLVPIARYDYGDVVVYGDSAQTGMYGFYEFSDDCASLIVRYRMWAPCVIPGHESYYSIADVTP